MVVIDWIIRLLRKLRVVFSRRASDRDGKLRWICVSILRKPFDKHESAAFFFFLRSMMHEVSKNSENPRDAIRGLAPLTNVVFNFRASYSWSHWPWRSASHRANDTTDSSPRASDPTSGSHRCPTCTSHPRTTTSHPRATTSRRAYNRPLRAPTGIHEPTPVKLAPFKTELA